MEAVLVIFVAFVAWLFLKGRAASGEPATPAVDTSAHVDSYNPFNDLAAAWANAEGWNVPGSLAQRNNNPVNLTGTGWPGQIGTDKRGFAIFSDVGSGFGSAQLYLQQQAAAHPAWTLRNLFAKILGNLSGQPVNNDQGNSNVEAQNVANYLGISPDMTLESYGAM